MGEGRLGGRAWLVLAVVLAAAPARAQNADVPALIKIIENQPSEMDRSEWKEKRRDAARKLGQSKDKRAVPVLAKLAENETFDIIGEIAIEGLGAIGDPSAVPTLQKIVGDPSRDKGQRDLARKALGRLGASPEGTPPNKQPDKLPDKQPDKLPPDKLPPPPDGNPTPPTGHPETAPPTGGHDVLGEHHRGGEEPLELPQLDDDVLAAYERVTFAGGTATLGYDTLVKRLSFAADVAGDYEKRVEREKSALGYGVTAHVVTGLVSQSAIPETGMNSSSARTGEVVVNGHGEARFYSGQLYGVGKAALQYQLDYTSFVFTDNTGNQMSNKFTQQMADLEVALGGGFGRVLDVGGAIRVRRLARTLDAARALGKPIDAAVAKKLQLAWWALRGERSTYRALLATVAILREAGVLLSEPDAGLSYELLNVLRDSWLYVRPSGIDLQVAFGEGYLMRPTGNNAMYPMSAEEGRVEQLLAQAGYGAQLDDDKVEIAGSAYGRLRLFNSDPMGQPWAIGATASLRRFTYSDHGDPFGLFDLTGNVGLSDDGLMMSQQSLHIEGDLGFTYWLNQASGIRLAGQVIEDGGAIFLGASLTATYGLLDGTFAR